MILMRDPPERRTAAETDARRSRKARIDRVRRRLDAIHPEDGDMIDFKSILKALLDIMADDGDEMKKTTRKEISDYMAEALAYSARQTEETIGYGARRIASYGKQEIKKIKDGDEHERG